MIKSARPYPIHTLLNHEGNRFFWVPPYQRAYSWHKREWEDLFRDLVEAQGEHFLGTIITLHQGRDELGATVSELIDGQQRMTTLTLLLAATYSVLNANIHDLDEDDLTDFANLGRQLVRKKDSQPRVTPQTQSDNLDDYLVALNEAGLGIGGRRRPYYRVGRIAKCYSYFVDSIHSYSRDNNTSLIEATQRVRKAAQNAIIVEIEVDSHADAFTLFESLNYRGVPLTPVDLIKNLFLAQCQKHGIMTIDAAFRMWNEMLNNLGENYASHERFLRQHYNAFKNELPKIENASVATRSNLIQIYETFLSKDSLELIDRLVAASKVYGRITGVNQLDQGKELDRDLRNLLRAQGAPSYILLLWLMSYENNLGLDEDQLTHIVSKLVAFFVRRNLTGYPQTYALPKLFMGIIERLEGLKGKAVIASIESSLVAASSSDEAFMQRLHGPIYEENSDVDRFILATLSEDAMTKETSKDLWQQESGKFIWTIEHIFPQGERIPAAWEEMMGGPESAKATQAENVHMLGNLTITAYNSNLSNKPFTEKRDRVHPSNGSPIGYRNGLVLNRELAQKDRWTRSDITERTDELAAQVLARFPV